MGYAQHLPQVKIPTYSGFQNQTIVGFPNTAPKIQTPHQQNYNPLYDPMNPNSIYQQDLRRVQEREKQLQEIRKDIAESNKTNQKTIPKINYAFPSGMSKPKATLYLTALEELQAMLKNQQPINLKKAIYRKHFLW
jgi:hypothetical protein